MKSTKELASHDVAIDGAEKEFSIGQSIDVVLKQEFDPEPAVNMDAMALEKFMHDPIELILNDPANEEEAPFAEVTVNGDRRVLWRNGDVSITLPRKHVEVLAHAKTSRVKQEKIVAADGSMGYVDKVVTTLAYPFTVVGDPAGMRGRDWLKKQLSAAA